MLWIARIQPMHLGDRKALHSHTSWCPPALDACSDLLGPRTPSSPLGPVCGAASGRHRGGLTPCGHCISCHSCPCFTSSLSEKCITTTLWGFHKNRKWSLPSEKRPEDEQHAESPRSHKGTSYRHSFLLTDVDFSSVSKSNYFCLWVYP